MNIREQKAARKRVRAGELKTNVAKTMLVSTRSVSKAVAKKHTNRKRSGRPRSQVRQDSGGAINAILEDEGVQHSISGMSKRLDVPRRTMQRVIKDDLELKSLRRTRRHNPLNRPRRFQRAMDLGEWLSDPDNISRVFIWTDEKAFSAQEACNPTAQRFLCKDRATATATVPDDVRHVLRQQGAKELLCFVALFSSGEWFMKVYPPKTKVDKWLHIETLKELLVYQEALFGDAKAPGNVCSR